MRDTQAREELRREGCHNCGQPHGQTTPDQRIELDHIQPTARGGPDTIKNLQPLCGTCNRYKNSWTHTELNTRTFHEWRQTNRERPTGTPITWPTGFDWTTETYDDGQPAKWIWGEHFNVPIHPRDTWRIAVPLHDHQPFPTPLVSHGEREERPELSGGTH